MIATVKTVTKGVENEWMTGSTITYLPHPGWKTLKSIWKYAGHLG